MFFLKLKYHICSLFSMVFYKLIYNNKIHFGKSVTWRRALSIMIDKNGFINIGDNCFFNNYCSLNSNNSIVIGNNCIFGEGVKIYDHNHKFNNKSLSIFNQGFSNGKVIIGNNCWIASNVVILKDTEIGNNCVIGAGCIIKGKIPDNTIVKNSMSNIIEEIV